jgi:hypothetical protein
MHENFFVRSKNVRLERCLLRGRMELVVGTPFSVNRGLKKDSPSLDFFGAKLKTLLLRTRGAMEACAHTTVDPSFAVLSDSDAFGDVTTLDEVEKCLGGKDSLAWKVLKSVTDEDEMHQLELYSRERKGQEDELVMAEIQSLVVRVQALARRLPNNGDSLIRQVLELPSSDSVEEEDEGGTGEQEESKTDEKKKKTRSSNTAKSKKKTTPLPKKRERQSAEKSKERQGKKVQKTFVDTTGKGKEEMDVEDEEEEVVDSEEEDAVCLLEKDEQKTSGLCESDVMKEIEEAEKEFDSIRALQESAGQVTAEEEQWQGPPNVEELIASVRLDDVDCLCEVDKVPLNSIAGRLEIQMWWRLVKRACQIRGLFQLIRAQKSKVLKIQERYSALVSELLEGHRDVLSYTQASRYERLGKFLVDFPLFVFQRKWVTLTDWFQKIDCGNGKDAVLVDCMASIVHLSSVFLRDSFALHEDGFQVFPGMMSDCISQELIDLCKTRCKEVGEVVFNNSRKVNSRQNDKKRMQLSVDRIDGAAMARFKQVLTERLSGVLPRHKVSSMVALLSKLFCKAQLAHTDFSPDTLSNVLLDDKKMPLACLVVLMDGTVFDVWPGAIRFEKNRDFKPMHLKLRAGDVLIFRGDLVHAGAAVGEVENVRFHAYLDVEGVVRPKHKEGDMEVEETYFMCDEKNILKR